MREEHRRFQRRLPRAYSRFDDGHPGRRQIGSGGWADRGCHSNNRSPSWERASHQAPEGPRPHPRSPKERSSRQALSGGFHNASIEAGNRYWDYRHPPTKVPLSRNFPYGANGIRTRDLLLAKQALSQLSYGPDPGSSLGTQPSKSKSRGGRCSNHSRSWSGASWRNSGVLSSTSSPSSSSGSSSYSSVSWSRCCGAGGCGGSAAWGGRLGSGSAGSGSTSAGYGGGAGSASASNGRVARGSSAAG